MSAETIKRKTLGRGLNALFGEQDEPADGATDAAPKIPTTLPVEMLAPSPLQPRRHFDETALSELANSIKEKGILQPILVRPDPNRAGHFEIIAGERRWRAAQRAQLHDVPVLVRDLSDGEVLEVALIENLQRQDLSAVEEGRGYQRLIDDFSHTQEEISEIVGKSRGHVANMLRLLQLPEGVQRLIDDGKINVGQARPLIGLKNAEALALTISRRGLSARQSERLAKNYGKTKRLPLRTDKDADTRALEHTLEDATGYHVDITFNGKGGKVVIAYSSLEQLDDIVKRLSAGGKRPKSDDGRDIDTVYIEGLLASDDLLESEEHLAHDDRRDVYQDSGASGIGSSGSLTRQPQTPNANSETNFGLSKAPEDSHKVDGHFGEDKNISSTHPNPHEDSAAYDVGSIAATHR